VKIIAYVTASFAITAAVGVQIALPDSAMRIPSSQAPLLAGAEVPPHVVSTIEKSCGNCHSLKTEWPLYSKIFPFSSLIESDVAGARGHINLSRWESYDNGEKSALLSEIGSVVRNHVMPPRRYTLIHPDSKLTAADGYEIYEWTRAERKRLKSLEQPSVERNMSRL
jgi:hypothetical protein